MAQSQSAALVTGGAIRLGRAMALGLARRGQDVVLHYASSQADAEKTAQDVRKLGVNCEILQADLLDEDGLADIVPAAASAIGKPLSVLVNNASIFEYDNIETATRENWDRHFGSNLRAPFVLTQQFAAQAPDITNDGRPLAQANVINMIDQRVNKLTPEFMTYTLAKSALWTFTQTAAQALGPQIRVNGIAPGPTMQGVRQSAEHFARQREATPLQRGADADAIVSAMNYLLDANSVTGQLLFVDGGQNLTWRTIDMQGIEE